MKQRVQVFGGAGKEDLGTGWLVGYVTVHYFASYRNGSPVIRSVENPEQKPSFWTRAKMHLAGYGYGVGVDNPKIELDSGRVVYGCQVWWRPIGDEEHEA